MQEQSTDEPLDGLHGRAAGVIEDIIRELAFEYGLGVSSCVWNLGQGFALQGPHRLDLFLVEAAIKIYFTDEELICHLDAQRSHEIKKRLRSLLVELHNEALPIPLTLALERLANRLPPC